MKEEVGTCNLNQGYDKFNVKQDNSMTRHILDIDQQEMHGHIDQWQLMNHYTYSYTPQNLPNYEYIPFFLSTFILISVCLFITGSIIFHRILIWEIQIIF